MAKSKISLDEKKVDNAKELPLQDKKNKQQVLDIIAKTKDSWPYGFQMVAKERHVEISILRGSNKGIAVCQPIAYSLSAHDFANECNNACEALHRMAKRYEREQKIHDCEANAVNGKCPCGYNMTGKQNVDLSGMASANMAKGARNSISNGPRSDDNESEVSKEWWED